MQKVFFITLLFFNICTGSFAQVKPIPDKISVHADNIPFEKVMIYLSEKYSIQFFYSSSKIPVSKIVTFNADETDTNIVLSELCNQLGITFSIRENQVILMPQSGIKAKRPTISGFISDLVTGESLIGADVVIINTGKGTVSNSYGYYTYTLPEGRYHIRCSYLGYEPHDTIVEIYKDCKICFLLAPQYFELKEIKLGLFLKERKQGLPPGTDLLPMEMLKQYPALLGENDIVQFIKMMPGVQTNTDGLNGLYIRGSMPQHTSFQIDDAPMLNMYHFSGWFSTINPDAVKDVRLYKSHLPSKTGGPLSSVVDIRLRDGNNQKFAVTAGVGAITSRITLEGPIIKNKASFIFSARRSYIDKIIEIFKIAEKGDPTDIFFYDLNAKINYTFNDKNRIYLSGYSGRDKANERDGMDWGNSLISWRWNHLFSNKLFSNLTLTTSSYNHHFSGYDSDNLIYRFSILANNYSAKYDFTSYTISNNKLYFGTNAMLQYFYPITLKSQNITNTNNFELSGPQSQLLSNVYFQGDVTITNKLKTEPGIKITYLYKLKPKDLKTKFLFSPSLNLQYKVNEKLTFKSGYSRNYQSYHGVAVFDLLIPFDRYLLATDNFPCQYADHFSVALNYFNKHNNLEINVEPYLSLMRNQYRFLLKTDFFEEIHPGSESFAGKTNAYGWEYSMRKHYGRFTGLISYTWAKTKKKENGINNNEFFNPYYYRKHDLVFNASFLLKPWFQFSSTWVYMSGNPYNMPVGKYELRGRSVPLYNKNEPYNLQMPAYHRLDIGVRFIFNKARRYNHNLMFTAYNVYSRINPALYTYRDVADGNPDKDPDLSFNTRNFSMLGYYFLGFMPAFAYELKFE
ncbi:MAG: TonB-dependent receptor [Bacteroidales bacterium]